MIDRTMDGRMDIQYQAALLYYLLQLQSDFEGRNDNITKSIMCSTKVGLMIFFQRILYKEPFTTEPLTVLKRLRKNTK